MARNRVDYLYRATLIKCVDGDTVDLEVDLGFFIFTRIRFRLDGIDTPERGQDGYAEATTYLETLLKDKQIYVRSRKTGKYGRWLGTLFVNGTNINNEMLATGLAKEY